MGTILRNPVDTQWILSITPEQLSNIINLVAGWEGIDVLIVHYAIDIGPLLFHEIDSEPLDALIDSLIQSAKACGKPIAIVFHSVAYAGSWETFIKNEQKCVETGLPVFHSVANAAHALSKFIQYHEDYRRDRP